MSEVVEPDAAEPGLAEQGGEVSGEGGPFDRGATRPGGDVAAVLPTFACCFVFLALPTAMLVEGAQALRRQDYTPFGTLSLGREDGQATGVGAQGGAPDVGSSVGQVEIFPTQAKEFALAESGVQSDFEQRLQPVTAGCRQKLARFLGSEGLWPQCRSTQFCGSAKSSLGGDVAPSTAHCIAYRTASASGSRSGWRVQVS